MPRPLRTGTSPDEREAGVSLGPVWQYTAGCTAAKLGLRHICHARMGGNRETAGNGSMRRSSSNRPSKVTQLDLVPCNLLDNSQLRLMRVPRRREMRQCHATAA